MERDGLCAGCKIKRAWNKICFGGAKDDPTKPYGNAISKYGSTQAFKDDKELAEKRKEAGAVRECCNDTNFR